MGIGGDQINNGLSSAGAVYVFVRSGATWIQQAYLKASNTEDSDVFGASVAISGDTLVVGANLEDSDADAVDGSELDGSAPSAGAAYVFVRSGVAWSQQAYLKAPNSDAGDEFGAAVAISGDTILVGARFEASADTGVDGNPLDNTAGSAGAAYVFTRSGIIWSFRSYLKGSNTEAGDRFGSSVAISGDTAVVGAPLEDSAATGVGGDQADATESGSGAAYVFTRAAATWSQAAYLKASNTDSGDQFGSSVSVSGNTVLVGAPFEAGSASGVNGDPASNTAASAGAAYTFVRGGTTWFPEAYLKAFSADSGDQFGRAVAVAGNHALVGAFREDGGATGVGGDPTDNSAESAGAAFLFERAGPIWTPNAYLKALNPDPEDRFGGAVALSPTTAVIGASLEDSAPSGVDNPLAVNDNAAAEAGAAYSYNILPVAAPTPPDLTRPTVRVKGRRRVESTRRRVVFRGTAADASGIDRVEFKASGVRGGFQEAKGPGTRWRAVIRPNTRKRQTVVKVRAFDNAGNRSKIFKLRIIRR